MDWEQKLEAMQALCECSLKMRCPGNWYVETRKREVGGDGLLSSTYGNGSTPQKAVEDDWRRLVEELPPASYIVLDPHEEPRKTYRWNGYRWAERVLS